MRSQLGDHRKPFTPRDLEGAQQLSLVGARLQVDEAEGRWVERDFGFESRDAWPHRYGFDVVHRLHRAPLLDEQSRRNQYAIKTQSAYLHRALLDEQSRRNQYAINTQSIRNQDAISVPAPSAP